MGAPGPDLPPTSAHPSLEDSAVRKPSSRCHLRALGKWRPLPGRGQARREAAGGRSQGREPPGSLHQCLRSPPPGGPWCLLPPSPPFSPLRAAIFLCCQTGPLGPFQLCLGEGQGASRPPPGTQPGTVGTTCLACSARPGWPRPVQPGTAAVAAVEVGGGDLVSCPIPGGLAAPGSAWEGKGSRAVPTGH